MYDLWWWEEAAVEEAVVQPSSGGGLGFAPNGANAADLWRRRNDAISTLARRRMQPRSLAGGRR